MLRIIGFEGFLIIVAVFIGFLIYRRLIKSKKLKTIVEEIVNPEGDVVSEYNSVINKAFDKVEESKKEEQNIQKQRRKIQESILGVKDEIS